MERHWSEAKIPNWVQDSIERDLREQKLTAALSWPTQSKPEPLPFRWGDYDKVVGEPQEGVFWFVMGGDDPYPEKKYVRKTPKGDTSTWKSWQFSPDGKRFSASVPRGPIFGCEYEAYLYCLWMRCEKAARDLLVAREKCFGK